MIKCKAKLKHNTIAGFWPLLAEVASPLQAKKLQEHLKDPKTFWRANPWPSLAADEPEYDPNGNYWRGGVWSPTQAMVAEGLSQYGYNDLCYKAVSKYLQSMATVFKDTGTIWEFYKPDSAMPGQIWGPFNARKDFVGWSGIGPIQLLIENVLGFKLDVLKNELNWNIQSCGRHGIRNLRFGNSYVDAEISSRDTLKDDLIVKINFRSENENLLLKILVNNKVYEHSLQKGEQVFSINLSL